MNNYFHTTTQMYVLQAATRYRHFVTIFLLFFVTIIYTTSVSYPSIYNNSNNVDSKDPNRNLVFIWLPRGFF